MRILFIVPYPDLKKLVVEELKGHPDQHRIQMKIIVATVDKVPKFDPEQYDVIIARGYTAKQTKASYLNIPTVELAISSFDIIRSLQETKMRYNPKKVAFCGFYSALYGAKDLGSFLDCDVEVYRPNGYEELEEALIQAKKEGCETIIGGYSAKLFAEKYGMPSTIIKTGGEGILQALNEAIRTVDMMRVERVKAEMYRTITKSSKEGILFVDPKGIIQVDNPAAQQMAGKSSLCFQALEQTHPFLLEGFRKAVETKMEIFNAMHRLNSRTSISVSFLPVIIKQEVTGVVINLVDVSRIQTLEGQIRRKLSEKGHHAKYTFKDVIHESAIMGQTIARAKKFAKSTSNIIIVGETGTGKEVFAQSIHNTSQRSKGPFVAVNCAALPENLLESELFGHVEGAFTGTSKGGKMGLFEQAHNGTLFLDEISEITPALQSKLLRALQEREVRRIGDDRVISIDVRVISATNKSLNSLAARGLFRRDLLYRLDVLRIFLPPLRKRENDVERIFLSLMAACAREQGKQMPSVDPSALTVLRSYPFDGNIRELMNIVERVLVTMEGVAVSEEEILEVLYPEDLEQEGAFREEPLLDSRKIGDHALSPKRIQEALEACGGNKTQAAELLGINRTTLWRRLKEWENE